MKHSKCYVLFCGDTVMGVTFDKVVMRKYRNHGGRVEIRDTITPKNFIKYPWLKIKSSGGLKIS